MRVFIAIPLPNEIRKELVKIQKDLAEFPAKWAEKDNLHITLVFVGEIEERPSTHHHAVRHSQVSQPSSRIIEYDGERDLSPIAQIASQLRRITTKAGPIKLKTDGLALFPDEHKARLLVIELAGETDRLHSLVEDIKRHLREAKIDFDEKPFHPHITLARLKRVHPRKRRRIGQKVGDYEMPEETFNVGEVILLESKLTATGPIYKVVRPPFQLGHDKMK